MNLTHHPPHPAILIAGPTGSGKTPLGQALASHGLHGQACVHFDFGHQLRLAADGLIALPQDDTTTIATALQAGRLLHADEFHVARTLLKAFLDQTPPNATVIMNGLPRNIDQAINIAELVSITYIIELVCDAETALNRIQCNSGGDRTHRQDDQETNVRQRLARYQTHFSPLRQWFVQQGVSLIPLTVQIDTTPEVLIAQLSDHTSVGKDVS